MKSIGKNISYKFKKFIKSFVSIFASREFAFVYCLIGTFGQITHCYFLLYSVSSFSGFFRILQAVVLSIFISSSLLYFVSIADKDDEEHEYKRIIRAINMFMVIEIAINMYYYAQNLLIKSAEMRIFDFIFAIIISCLLPITIKLYANSIKAKEWLKELESEDNESKQESLENTSISQIDESSLKTLIENTSKEISNDIFKKYKTDLLLEIQNLKKEENSSFNFDVDRLNSYIEEKLNEKLKDYKSEDGNVDIEKLKSSVSETIDSKIKDNMNMFLKQFDNKVDYRIRQYMIKSKNEQFENKE